MAKKKTDKKYDYFKRSITLPSGKRKWLYGKTKEEVDKKYNQIAAEIAGKVDVEDKTIFFDFAKLWYETYKEPYLRPTSLERIRCALNTHVFPHLAELKVKDITSLHIQQVVGEMARKNYSHANAVLGQMREIFDAAVDLKLISVSPVPRSLKVKVSTEHRQKIVIPPHIDAGMREILPDETAEKLYWCIGVDTGMRRGEIYALNWAVIDLERQTIKVCRKVGFLSSGTYVDEVTKTEAGMRTVPMSDDLKNELLAYGSVHGFKGYLFSHDNGKSIYTPAQANTLWYRVRNYARKVDAAFGNAICGHDMRHTFITRLFEAGLDIKEIQTIAGHKDVTTTLNIYTHYDAERRQDTTWAKVREAVGQRGNSAPEVVNIDDLKKLANG